MSDPPQMPEPPKPKWTGAAITFFAIGLLIFIPSGLCTGVMGIGAIVDSYGSNGFDYGILIMALVVGGPFMLIGALLMRTGLRERQRDAQDRPKGQFGP
jgi:hypothetical protein